MDACQSINAVSSNTPEASNVVYFSSREDSGPPRTAPPAHWRATDSTEGQTAVPSRASPVARRSTATALRYVDTLSEALRRDEGVEDFRDLVHCYMR